MTFLKKTTPIFAALAAMGYVASVSTDAQAASANGTANATIVTAIAITAGTALDFGSVGNGANTVTVSTAGARSATDGTQLAGGTPAAASFNVSGDGASAFTVTLPASATINNGANSLTVNNFTHNAPANLTAGSASFNVGADLVIAGGEPAGAYTGSFTVTVNY